LQSAYAICVEPLRSNEKVTQHVFGSYLINVRVLGVGVFYLLNIGEKPCPGHASLKKSPMQLSQQHDSVLDLLNL
jgi:hypothetical protein